jgi:hypothetical protein
MATIYKNVHPIFLIVHMGDGLTNKPDNDVHATGRNHPRKEDFSTAGNTHKKISNIPLVD